MSLLCSLSGAVAVKPVLNPRSGRIYDQHNIEQHLLTSSTDPVTNDPLKPDDLIPIHPSSLSLPPFLTHSPSAPSQSLSMTLQSLSKEFDGMMLEQFMLKKEIYTLKQELAHSLYQYDAACRVIARLTKERDEARAVLANGAPQPQSTVPESASDSAMETEPKPESDLHSTFATILGECAEHLSGKGGKKRRAAVKARAANTVARDSLLNLTLHSTHSPLANQSSRAIVAMDVDYSNVVGGMAVVGGSDGAVAVFDCTSDRVLHTIQAHKKRVTDVTFLHPSLFTTSLSSLSFSLTPPLPILSASADGSVALHAYDTASGNYQQRYQCRDHSGSVSLSVHPSSLYWLSASIDGSWFIYDTDTGKRAVTYTGTNSEPSNGFTSAQFHPDGRIVGLTVSDSTVKIFDASTAAMAASFTGHRAEPLTLAFSPNGYIAATGDSDGIVKLWDLRHVGSDKPLNFANIETNAAVCDLVFDESAKWLVAGSGCETKVYDAKSLECVVTVSSDDEVTGVRVGPGATRIYSASRAGTLGVYQTPVTAPVLSLIGSASDT